LALAKVCGRLAAHGPFADTPDALAEDDGVLLTTETVRAVAEAAVQAVLRQEDA
jgi:hypothetical protein